MVSSCTDLRSVNSLSSLRSSALRSWLPNCCAVAVNRRAMSSRMFEAVLRRLFVDERQYSVDIQARRFCPNEQGRIDPRFPQRQCARDALDVHAVTDLEEPVLHQIPVSEQGLVRRHAEGHAPLGLYRAVGIRLIDDNGLERRETGAGATGFGMFGSTAKSSIASNRGAGVAASIASVSARATAARRARSSSNAGSAASALGGKDRKTGTRAPGAPRVPLARSRVNGTV